MHRITTMYVCTRLHQPAARLLSIRRRYRVSSTLYAEMSCRKSFGIHFMCVAVLTLFWYNSAKVCSEIIFIGKFSARTTHISTQRHTLHLHRHRKNKIAEERYIALYLFMYKYLFLLNACSWWWLAAGLIVLVGLSLRRRRQLNMNGWDAKERTSCKKYTVRTEYVLFSASQRFTYTNIRGKVSCAKPARKQKSFETHEPTGTQYTKPMQ